MNQYIMLFLLYTVSLFGQISPDEFPVIGYFDFYYKQYHENEQNGANHNYVSSGYYYDSLQSLGITHMMSFANLNNDNSLQYAEQAGIKIIDASTDYYNFLVNGLTINTYCKSNGNDPNNDPYQAGGGSTAYLNDTRSNYGNYGYGSNGDSANNSFWLRRDGSGIDYVGNIDTSYFSKRVYKAGPSTSGGVLLHLRPSPLHIANTGTVVLNIVGRMGNLGTLQATTPIARVEMYEIDRTSSDPNYETCDIDVLSELPSGPVTLPTPTVVGYLVPGDFSQTTYQSKTLEFTKIQGREDTRLDIRIVWLDQNCEFYIDNVSLYDKIYEQMIVLNDQTLRGKTQYEVFKKYRILPTRPPLAKFVLENSKLVHIRGGITNTQTNKIVIQK